MKTTNRLIRLGLAAALTGLTGTGAYAASVNGTSTATVIAPLSIAENVAMDFGTVSGGTAVGTVVLDTASGRTVTGDAQIVAAGAGAAGDFTITGEAGQAYTMTFSASGTLSDGAGNTMTVDTFTDNSSGTLPAATENFQVGATLNVGASQAAGAYSTANAGGAPYTITVNYN